ncbi:MULTISPECIES: hypothetical protein [unclassified Rhizobium]|uniref:hypothetical protein n=1 Tax=unclassified Rhizobium TaxID=2613769 RepID=UPI00105133B2|nr:MULTISPECIES: hypothetical protein [unclassified Rhizobium]
MFQFRKLLAAGAAVIVLATISSCTTSSDSSIQTGSVGYGQSADFGLRPACLGGFGNDRPCSY